MRSGTILALLLIIPLASGLITNVDIPEVEQKLRHEIIITSNQNQWTQSMWDELELYGITPLRLLSDTEALVWRNDLSLIELVGFDLSNGHDVNWRGGGIGLEDYLGEIRVVFEPNLPPSAFEYLVASFSSLGLEISNNIEDYNSVIPHKERFFIDSGFEISSLLNIDGVLWIEPVLSTDARNLQAASLMATGGYLQTTQWSYGLNGSGVVLGIADSGIDGDHSCFLHQF